MPIPEMPRAPGDQPRPHPARRAFVVQLEEGCGAPGQAFAGRVDHLASGRRFHFASPAELLGIVGSFLSADDEAQIAAGRAVENDSRGE